MLKDYKEALAFVAKYVLVYLILNTLYAFYIDGHRPDADPLTTVVAKQVASLLAVYDGTVHAQVVRGSMNVPVAKGQQVIIEVFEGCNGVNVMVVFISFLIAFRGPGKATIIYLLLGLGVIYLLNLLRVMGLYWVALYYPMSLYYFHKFFFTGALYAVVFLIWYFWVKRVSRWKTAIN